VASSAARCAGPTAADPAALPFAAEFGEAEHVAVKGDVARIDFDDVVGEAVQRMRVQVGDMDQRREHALRHALVDGQARGLAQAAALAAQDVEPVAEMLVGRQHAVAAEAQAHRPDQLAPGFRVQGHLVPIFARARVDGVAAPRIHAPQQHAGVGMPLG
jgi:hypothetical protein